MFVWLLLAFIAGGVAALVGCVWYASTTWPRWG